MEKEAKAKENRVNFENEAIAKEKAKIAR